MEPQNNETVFYLVRHGEGEQNVRRILSPMDNAEQFGLTETGLARVRQTAEELCAEGVDVIIASPLRRTRETAQIISDVTGIGIEYDERLRETDFGIWSGKSADDFWKKYPDPLLRIDGNTDDRLEGFLSLRKRIGESLLDMYAKYAGKKIVIVSHGDPLEQCHGILTGENIAVTLSGWYPKKGEATKVVVAADFWKDFDERESCLRIPIPTDATTIHPERR